MQWSILIGWTSLWYSYSFMSCSVSAYRISSGCIYVYITYATLEIHCDWSFENIQLLHSSYDTQKLTLSLYQVKVNVYIQEHQATGSLPNVKKKPPAPHPRSPQPHNKITIIIKEESTTLFYGYCAIPAGVAVFSLRVCVFSLVVRFDIMSCNCWWRNRRTTDHTISAL